LLGFSNDDGGGTQFTRYAAPAGIRTSIRLFHFCTVVVVVVVIAMMMMMRVRMMRKVLALTTIVVIILMPLMIYRND